MAEPQIEPPRSWNPARYRLGQARRTRPLCAADTVEHLPCEFKAVMLWFGIPFCPTHAPAQRPGHGGWERL